MRVPRGRGRPLGTARGNRAGRVRHRADEKVGQLYTPLLNLLKDGGYEIVGEDNEGFEAEIFFTRNRNTGSLILRQGDCADATNITLTYGA